MTMFSWTPPLRRAITAFGAAILLSLAMPPMPGAAGEEAPSHPPIALADVGSFFIPGRQVELRGLPDLSVSFAPGAAPVPVSQNGEFETGQMYVQYYRQARPAHPLPILFWHGGGLTGSVWESTPDGRPGWLPWFLRRGYDSFVSDSVERGRSGFSQFPQVYRSAPLFRTKQEAWEAFRLGGYDPDPEKRTVSPGLTFPIEHFDAFTREGVPRWVDNDATIQEAYGRLVEKVCPCVVIAHSQGSIFALHAAATHPDLVRALVLLEPSGVPALSDGQRDILKAIPQLFVWGDFIPNSKLWQFYQKRPADYFDRIKAGGKAEWLDLPAAGLTGNSHLLMLDRTSDQVAERVATWLDRNVH